MSGASRLPPRLLRILGDAASLISPDLRHLMHIVDLMYDETRAIWETHEIARKDERDRQDVLLKPLRTSSPMLLARHHF